VGRRYHVHSAEGGVCLFSGADGCVYAQYTRLAFGYHHSDQGVQYAANDYVQLLEENKIEISMAGVGKAYENGYAERLMRTIKEEEVDLSEYRNCLKVIRISLVFLSPDFTVQI